MALIATQSISNMQWSRLINDRRLGLEEYHGGHRGSRTDFQRDYDRLVFSSPFRRLQNKTQVFPLPGSIFVHNRLTHSVEVACVGRSLANEIAGLLRERYAHDHETLQALESIGDVVAAACLAHDLGNPPFGHSGEKAIATFFSEGPGTALRDRLTEHQWADLTNFEGNANTLRLLTHQFNGRRPGGFAMTYSTIAAIVKYPYDSTALRGGGGKFGFFCTETETFRRVAETLGMKQLSGDGEPLRYVRHPLVYIVEAADDICYEIMDIEDAHKLGLLPTSEVISLLLTYFDNERQERCCRVMSRLDDPNEKIAYLRSCIIGHLVEACARTFADHEAEILAGTFEGPIINRIPAPASEGYRACVKLSWQRIYTAADVVNIELAGNRIISDLMERLVKAVCHPALTYSQLLLSQVPKQYDIAADNLFSRVQAVVDHTSGMTDVYALEMYRRLNGMSLKLNN